MGKEYRERILSHANDMYEEEKFNRETDNIKNIIEVLDVDRRNLERIKKRIHKKEELLLAYGEGKTEWVDYFELKIIKEEK